MIANDPQGNVATFVFLERSADMKEFEELTLTSFTTHPDSHMKIYLKTSTYTILIDFIMGHSFERSKGWGVMGDMGSSPSSPLEKGLMEDFSQTSDFQVD
jgi:hypothetical protein